jgi:hypothetical protein
LTSTYFSSKELKKLSQNYNQGLRDLGQARGKAILVDTNIIWIFTTAFGKTLNVDTKELLMDVIFRCYSGQDIHVLSNQENIDHLGLTDFLLWVVRELNISPLRVHVSTGDPNYSGPFSHTYQPPAVFLAASGFIATEPSDCHADAKFIGTAIGRFSVSRLRLAHAMDETFPGDAVIVFQNVQSGLTQLNVTGGVYDWEIAWTQNRQFDQDLSPEVYAREYWPAGCRSYPAWSASFQIDVVAESNVFDCNFITEKIARPLATGKPFVLLGARHSLQSLRNQGFQTFHEFIDESYDEEAVPYRRINKIMQSLQALYHSPQRHQTISDMVRHAQHNIQQYKKFTGGR